MSNIAKGALKGVTYCDSLKADDGYSLFGTKESEGDWIDVVLINMGGYILNHWRLPRPMVAHGRLMPNGHFLYAGVVDSIPEMYHGDKVGRMGGELVELDWGGDMVWRADTPYISHDFYPFDSCPYDAWPKNGHVMYAAYHPDDAISRELTARWKGGIPGDEFTGEGNLDGRLVSDSIVEVDREGKVVWKWLASEHFDPDIDWIPPLDTRTHFHTNAVELCPDGNIVISPRCLSRVYKIEYPSGKVIKRYGENEIFHQHDCEALPNGNILVFDNGSHRPNYRETYSRSVEFDGKTGEIVWQYKADPPSVFYSAVQGGNERLPNGNTLICDSCSGRAFEVTPDCEIVWEYINPIMSRRIGNPVNIMFRFHRYPKDYTAFKDRDLDPAHFPWENQIWGPSAWRREFHPCIF